MQTVWINLLRELGQYDEAIKLFKSTANQANGFTVEMRRELLNMEGEAGHEDRMMESYRQLIESEPDELTWRAGLTQILLEKGQEQEAKALWTDYVNETDRGSLLLMSAQTLGEFGLDDLSKQTIERMVDLRAQLTARPCCIGPTCSSGVAMSIRLKRRSTAFWKWQRSATRCARNLPAPTNDLADKTKQSR